MGIGIRLYRVVLPFGGQSLPLSKRRACYPDCVYFAVASLSDLRRDTISAPAADGSDSFSDFFSDSTSHALGLLPPNTYKRSRRNHVRRSLRAPGCAISSDVRRRSSQLEPRPNR